MNKKLLRIAKYLGNNGLYKEADQIKKLAQRSWAYMDRAEVPSDLGNYNDHLQALLPTIVATVNATVTPGARLGKAKKSGNYMYGQYQVTTGEFVIIILPDAVGTEGETFEEPIEAVCQKLGIKCEVGYLGIVTCGTDSAADFIDTTGRGSSPAYGEGELGWPRTLERAGVFAYKLEPPVESFSRRDHDGDGRDETTYTYYGPVVGDPKVR